MHTKRISIVVAMAASLIATAPVMLATPASGQVCQRRMGPYNSIEQAEYIAQQARYAGYQTSGVWGEGGVVSDWSNRRYFFNVFGPC